MKKTLLLFLVLYGLGMFLSLNMNSRYKIYTYKSTMWADASGYYMYLPATFIYQWDFSRFPKGMDTLTGDGFSLDSAKSIIYTKYSCGLAFLELPFFCLAHLYCKTSGVDANGFTQPYVNSLLFAGVFYMLAGLFLLFYVLKAFYSKTVSLFTTILFPVSTNLYFYGIEHPGITHVYNFFLCAFLLWLLKNYNKRSLFLITPLCALIVLIRPTNIILLAMAGAFLVYTKYRQAKEISLRYAFCGLFLAALLILPQLFYWKYISGNWITDTYSGEHFIHWKSPLILEVLFAAHNGFFTYAPVLLFAFWGFAFKPVNKQFSISILILAGLLVYANASWWSWHFGCAYGGRAFIDYYPFFAFGLAAFIHMILSRPKSVRIMFMALCVLLATYNMMYIYGFDDCWRSSTWDYPFILTILKGEL